MVLAPTFWQKESDQSDVKYILLIGLIYFDITTMLQLRIKKITKIILLILNGRIKCTWLISNQTQ